VYVKTTATKELTCAVHDDVLLNGILHATSMITSM
jgi:hypothetical protein